MYTCDRCATAGVYNTLRVCRECDVPHWFCDECYLEKNMTAADMVTMGLTSKILLPKDLKEEKIPTTKWHKLTLIVPQSDGESSPKEWDWQDLIGCIDAVSVESCEPTTAPEAK